MNKTDDGTTPFLVHKEPPKGTQLVFNEISLRDHFAAAALQGMLGGLDRNTMRFLENTEYPSGKMASAAYNIADAMLKAREVKP